MDGKGLMKLESEEQEKELLQAEKVVRSAAGGGEGKAKAKEPTNRKVHTLLSSSGFCLPLIGVYGSQGGSNSGRWYGER